MTRAAAKQATDGERKHHILLTGGCYLLALTGALLGRLLRGCLALRGTDIFVRHSIFAALKTSSVH